MLLKASKLSEFLSIPIDLEAKYTELLKIGDVSDTALLSSGNVKILNHSRVSNLSIKIRYRAFRAEKLTTL